MSHVANRLGSYALLLAGLFATGYAVGEKVPGHAHTAIAGETAGPDHDGMHSSTETTMTDTSAVLGLQSVVNEIQLTVASVPDGSLTLSIADDGRRLTDFVDNHGAVLHTFVVSRDLARFQHVHPLQQADDSWAVTVDLSYPGAWRVVVEGTRADGSSVVLGTDVAVPGNFAATELADPDDIVEVDGIVVTRRNLDFIVTPTAGLATYLGQSAHLVAFRQGDLAFAHLHPTNDVLGDYQFSDTLPGPGTYRLFLQFTNAGDVITVPFTVEQR